MLGNRPAITCTAKNLGVLQMDRKLVIQTGPLTLSGRTNSNCARNESSTSIVFTKCENVEGEKGPGGSSGNS